MNSTVPVRIKWRHAHSKWEKESFVSSTHLLSSGTFWPHCVVPMLSISLHRISFIFSGAAWIILVFFFLFLFFQKKNSEKFKASEIHLGKSGIAFKTDIWLVHVSSWLVKKFFILSFTTIRNNMSELQKFKQKLQLPSGIERKNRRACIVSWLQVNSTLSRKVSNLCLIKGLYLIRSNVLASFKHVKVYHLFSKYL